MKNIEVDLLNKNSHLNGHLKKTLERQWRNLGRYTGKRQMKKANKDRLVWMSIATIIVYLKVLQLTLDFHYYLIDFILGRIQSILKLESLYLAQPSNSNLIFILGIYLALSPWILDIFLNQYYPVDNFSKERLARYPEISETIANYCQKYHRSTPQLKIIQTQIPFLVTYGIPFRTRIVISNGLLQVLDDAELATLYATELGHLLYGVPLISLLMTLVQIPYLIYWQIASLAEQDRFNRLKRPLAVLAAYFYALYGFWKWPALWLSRQRVYDRDRFAVELTKNPNALSRALLKMAISSSEQVVLKGYTPRILESFDLLLPLDIRRVLTLGSLSPQIPFESVLTWDYTNPQRHWLALFSTHPLLGDRLYLLKKYAQFWNLKPELNLVDVPLEKNSFWHKIKRCYPTLPLIPQALVWAIGCGIIFRCLFWSIGKISEQLQFQPLVWMYRAYPLLNAWVGWLLIFAIALLIFLRSQRLPSVFPMVVFLNIALDVLFNVSEGRFNWLRSNDPIFEAWVWIAFSFILILWNNRYFPPKVSSLDDPDLAELLSEPEIPYQGEYLTLTGRLLGHSGVGNWLGQDLLLQTKSGLIKLHFLASGGAIGELLSFLPRPCQSVSQRVTVRGWLRRGGSPYFDVELMTTQKGEKIQGGHQMFVTLLAIACAVWGAYKILQL